LHQIWQPGIAGIRLPEGLSGGHPAYVVQACDASLKHLGMDVIDLYGLRVDPTVPIEDTVGYDGWSKQGKVRYLALSDDPQTIRHVQIRCTRGPRD
jgi:aryl-alcohol dehydrogenase-like predicted oxidoreductase